MTIEPVAPEQRDGAVDGLQPDTGSTTSEAAPLPVFIASYSAPEGLFWAKLSAMAEGAALASKRLWK